MSSEINSCVFGTEVDAVPAPDVPLVTLERRLAAATTDEKRGEIKRKIKELLQVRWLCNRLEIDQFI